MQVFTIEQLSKNCFTGSDSIEISILEYGLIWKYIPDEKEFCVWYGEEHNGTNYWGFQNGRITIKDIKDIFGGDEWVNLEDVYKSIGTVETFEEWKNLSEISDEDIFSKYLDVVSYYGYESCFGSSYCYPSIIVESLDMNEIIENIMKRFKFKKIVSTSSLIGMICKEYNDDVYGELYFKYTVTENKTSIGTEWYDIQFEEIKNFGCGDMITRTITMY